MRRTRIGCDRGNADPAAVTLVVISDVQCTRVGNRRRHAACAGFIQALDYDALVNLGDEVDDGADTALWRDFDMHWGAVKAVIKPVKGTDAHIPLDVWKRYYRRDASYWSWDLGAWHLIALDYNMPLAAGTEQYAWLHDDLDAHRGRPTIVFAHLPAFSASSKHRGGVSAGVERDAFALALRHGVELWVGGHCHVYERYERLNLAGHPNRAGIRCFTVHNCGKHYHNSEHGSPLPVVHGDGSELGGVRFVLAADRYEWECLTVPGWGSRPGLVDAGSDRLKAMQLGSSGIERGRIGRGS